MTAADILKDTIHRLEAELAQDIHDRLEHEAAMELLDKKIPAKKLEIAELRRLLQLLQEK